MSSRRILGIVLLIGGVVALVFGLQATDAPAEQVTETFFGRYSDTTMALLIGGAVAVVAGILLTLAGRRG